MKYINLKFAMLLLISFFTSISACSSETIKKYDNYKIYKEKIEEAAPQYEMLKIYQNQENVFELKDYIINIEDYDNLLGNNKPILVLETFSGGAHCCYNYHIFELGKKFKIIQKIEAYDGGIAFKPQGQKKPYKLELNDPTFNYFYGPFSNTPKPTITLSFNGQKFAFDDYSMQHKITKNEYIKIAKDLDKKLENDQNILYVLDVVLKLIYSGNGNYAFDIINNFLEKYNFSGLTFSGVKPAPFKLELLCELKQSPYAKDIERINSKYFSLPTKCP